MGQKLNPVPQKGFHFRESDHTYWLDSRIIPGCTTVIEDVGIYDLSSIPRGVLDKAADRGHKAHLATQYLDQGILDWDSVHAELVPYVKAWEAFRKNEQFVPHPSWIEVPTWHTKFQYGVTPDRFGDFHKKEGPVPAIVEIKCTYSVEKYWGLQTASQAYAIASQGVDFDPQTVLRLAVKLNRDGTYTPDYHNKPTDFSEFMTCLKMYGMKRKYK